MALLKQGILGPFTGKCGPVIGYIRNGQFCIRTMPTHYRDRRSPQQLQNRSRFTLVMKMMSLLRPIITLGFHPLATDITEMNAATRENYYTLVKPSAHGLRYHFPGLILSRGPIEPLTTPIHTLSGSTLQLLWNSHTIPGAGQDNISVLLLNANRMAIKFFHNIAHRQDGIATLPLPSSWNQEETFIYILVERNGHWSNTHCPGTIPWNEQATPSTPAPAPSPQSTILTPRPPFFDTHQSAVKLLLPLPLTRDHG